MKLKKLVLAGFKSFADKTEFEFDDGISCIVGPNGCGKSNVVDAVKWVLGEQSAKSLRGSEMMDIIFNGSSSRKSAGGAEVSLIFDNTDGLLRPPLDDDAEPTDTVAITRRLFRSGTSEYLINKVPCRLRDVREMFMDTGNAYSLIEQGRVESFLQASQEDRRAIFDEAAGISKYKARKKEALRKLERVDQNLLRVNDILEEVEKRLRSIKYQAGKARSYQAHSERLKDLRSLFVLAKYHTLRAQRKGLKDKLDSGSDSLAQINARIDQLSAGRSSVEVEGVDLERSAREVQSRIAGVSGKITTCQERSEMLTGRIGELSEQVLTISARCEELEAKIEECNQELIGRRGVLEQTEAETAELGHQYEAAHEDYRIGELAITELQAQLEDAKAGTIDLLRRTAQLHNEIHGLDVRKENLHHQQGRLFSRAAEIDQVLESVLIERGELKAKLSDVQSVLTDAREQLDSAHAQSEQLSAGEAKLQSQHNATREARSGLLSRIQTLKEMHARGDGLGGGVKRVLEARRNGKLTAILGMLGDFIQTDTAHAHVVEAALAGADQQLLVERLSDLEAAGGELNEVLGDGAGGAGVAGVVVLCLDQLDAFSQDFAIGDCPCVIGRVIDHVQFDSRLGPAMWRLLGRTLIVPTLGDAARAAKVAPEGFRFVTLAGEVLEADGRVRIGAANMSAGVIARHSELVELESRQGELDSRIEELSLQCDEAKVKLSHSDALQQKLRTVIYEANTERVECESSIAQLNGQVEKLQREKPLISADLEGIAAEIEDAVRKEHETSSAASELERQNDEKQTDMERLDGTIASSRHTQQQLAGRMTELKVSLGRAEEKQRSIRESIAIQTRQGEQLARDLQAGRSEIELCKQRRADAEQGCTLARQEIDELYAAQQKLNVEAEELEETRRGLSARLTEISEKLSEQRKAHEEASEKVNNVKIELSEADVRIENLITRAADEMNTDVLEQSKSYQHDQTCDWDAVEVEIKELREKIERLGNVNLDAISEQEELEKRHDFLKTQLDDIAASQKQLDDLVQKINVESRQMFIETFESVRQHFQQLFRKLFGGGRADILLLDPQDVLESGIEIVARPPGKELRSLTLLSGGEKTMTALALLFSIFKAKPSPFCLLDEVDAALDETNTERFSHLLQEFTDNSQFIIISHAKRTMAMASVLYGVTMQEPGVSKRISVRFEEIDHKMENELAGDYEPVKSEQTVNS